METKPSQKLNLFVGEWALDMPWLVSALTTSYWGGHYTSEKIHAAVERSVCFSAYYGAPASGRQVAFARVLTDNVLTSVLNDVIVDEKHRRQGVGTAFLKMVLSHHKMKSTICVLQARPENSTFYQKFGFVPVGSMYKRDPR